MNDEPRRSEQERRQEAHQHAGDVVAGSGRAVAPRRLGQMISVRLDPGLVQALRDLANRRGITVSEALREAAVLLLEANEVASKTTVSWQVVSVPTVPSSGATKKDVSAAS